MGKEEPLKIKGALDGVLKFAVRPKKKVVPKKNVSKKTRVGLLLACVSHDRTNLFIGPPQAHERGEQTAARA